MKNLLFLLLLLPVLGIGQTKTVLSSNRLFAKNDKVGEFEKALSSHAQKYHKVTLPGGYGSSSRARMQADI